MQVENLGKLERRLSLSVPLAEIEKEVDSRLKRLSRTVRMAGFRPGKVPLKVVSQHYGYQVHNEVLNEKVGNAFSQAVSDQQLRVVGTPNIAAKSDSAPEGTIAFDATFEVYPEVRTGDLSSAQIEKLTTEVGEPEVDKTLEILRKQRVHFHDKGVAGEHGDGGAPVAANGDRVTVDFAGTLDGVPFEGGTAHDFVFVLGEARMLPEFESAALGLTVGEGRTFPLTFPADYHGKEIAGKTVEFTLTIKRIEWAHKPEIDAEFAKSLGIEDGDLDKMRIDVRANLEREVKKRVQMRIKDGVMSALLENSELDVPKSLVEGEVQRLRESTRAEMKQRGMKADDATLLPGMFQAQAERRVRLGLILAELVRAHGLQAKPEQVKAHIEDIAQSYDHPSDVVRWYYSDKSRMDEVEALVVEQNVVDYVLGQARVQETPVPFDDLMGKGSPA